MISTAEGVETQQQLDTPQKGDTQRCKAIFLAAPAQPTKWFSYLRNGPQPQGQFNAA
jgi:hypothetical protein